MNYKSPFALLGLPLIHIAAGKVENGRYRRGIAKGWIAVGDVSFGVVLSLGGVAFGGVAVGGLAVGVFSLGGLAVGCFALGGGAVGILASGGAAVAWQAANGGFAAAIEYAQGGEAFARHANDLVAGEYFENSRFFSLARWFARYSRWCSLLLALPIGQGLIHRWKHRGSKQPRGKANG